MEATLDGVQMPVHQQVRRLRVGVPRTGTWPLLQHCTTKGKKAVKKTRTIPGRLDRKATVAGVMIVAVALF